MVAPSRATGQLGNTFVETALVLLPLCALLFGIVDFSMLIFLQSTLEESAREAARFATTYQAQYNGANCTGSQSACILRVAQDNAVGFLSGSRSSYLTINYYTANDLNNPVMRCTGGATCTLLGTLPLTLPSGVVVTFPNQPGNVVEVVIANYPWNWLAPMRGFMPGSGMNLTALSADVLGGLPTGATSPPNP